VATETLFENTAETLFENTAETFTKQTCKTPDLFFELKPQWFAR